MKNVPLLDLKPQNDPLREELLQAMKQVLDSQHFIMGPAVEQLEQAIAAYTRTRFAIGVSSGTDALLLALMTVGIGPGDEVITTPYSFFATAGAIARTGAKPVFVDIDPVTYNINPKKIKSVITSKTKAIMPVHLYGQSADMTSLQTLAKKNNLFIIEDAAQAIGSESQTGERVGGLGDFGCFSFFPSKNLGALGDAGVITTQSEELAEKARILRVHGSKPKYHHRWIGGNFRMDTIQAAVLNVKLPHLDGWTASRQENARRYDDLFQKTDLEKKKQIQRPQAIYSSSKVKHAHIYNQYVIRTAERDALMAFLKDQHIGTEVYYPIPLHLQDCFKSLGYKHGDFPESERAALDTLALPIYPGLTADQQSYVVEQIQTFYAKRSH